MDIPIKQNIIGINQGLEKLKNEYLYTITKWHPESFRKCKEVMKPSIDKTRCDVIDFGIFGKFFIIYYGTEKIGKSILPISDTISGYSYLDFCPKSIYMDYDNIEKDNSTFECVLKDILEKFSDDERVVTATNKILEYMSVLKEAKSILTML